MSTWIILTTWVGSGTFQDPYMPKVAIDYAIASWTNLNNDPPRPGGPATIEATLTTDVLQQILADPNYQNKVLKSN